MANFDGLRGTLARARMWEEEHGVAGFEGEERLDDGRRGGVGAPTEEIGHKGNKLESKEIERRRRSAYGRMPATGPFGTAILICPSTESRSMTPTVLALR